MGNIIKLKDTLLDDTSINYPKIIDLNDIHYDSRGKQLQVHWFPTASSGQKNGPNNSDGIVLSFCPHDSYVYQLAWVGGSPSKVFTRSKYVDVWYPWKELLLKEELPPIPPLINPIMVVQTTGGLTMSWSTAWTWKIIKFNRTLCNYGGCFTLKSDGSIIIGSGVSVVKVTSIFNWYVVENGGDKNVSLYKNGVNITTMSYSNSNDYYETASGVAIVSVQQGDTLAIQVNSGAAGSCNVFNNTTFMVEKIA